MPVSCEVSRPVASFFDFMNGVLEKFYKNDGIKTCTHRIIIKYRDGLFDEMEIVDFSTPIYKDVYNTNNDIHAHNVSSLMCFVSFFSLKDSEPRIIKQMFQGEPIFFNINYLNTTLTDLGYTGQKGYIFEFFRLKNLDFLAIRFSSEIIRHMHIDNDGNMTGSVGVSNDCGNEVLA